MHEAIDDYNSLISKLRETYKTTIGKIGTLGDKLKSI